ncbi:MAG: hypothetical protein SFU85_09260 [Candidatus Methylacidiphilales bacterium]|nr:hypothetical protein [Candidatus Methylacidiphilales bacterium]
MKSDRNLAAVALMGLLALVLLSGCAARRGEPEDDARYERGVERQFNENYEERLKY